MLLLRWRSTEFGLEFSLGLGLDYIRHGLRRSRCLHLLSRLCRAHLLGLLICDDGASGQPRRAEVRSCSG